MVFRLFKVCCKEDKLIGFFHDINAVYSFVSTRNDSSMLFLTFSDEVYL